MVFVVFVNRDEMIVTQSSDNFGQQETRSISYMTELLAVELYSLVVTDSGLNSPDEAFLL